MDVADRIPTLADVAPEAPNEPPAVEEDWAAYDAAHALWSEVWGDRLEFGHGTGGYGPGGQWTAAEWGLLGLRMAADWREAFDAMHQPKAA